MISLNVVHTYEAKWRSIVENKGYRQFNFSLKYEPVNDEVRIMCYWFGDDYSSTYLPQDLEKCGRFEFGRRMEAIDKHIKALPLESEQRDAKLVEDFAKLKERIAASRFAELFETEMQVLMDKLTTNVLEDKRVIHIATEHADGEGEGQSI